MRLVQVTIPSGKRDRLLTALDNEGIDYVVADETSGQEFDGLLYIPLPTNAVEPTLETLRESGLKEDSFTVVLEAKTVISERFDELQEAYAENEDEDRIAREELVTAARDLSPSFETFVIMSVVSAVIATAGLLLNSAAVVVGSMVIAPLMGPAMSASVGTVVNDRELSRRGIKLQIFGLVLSILAAFLFAFAVRHVHLVAPIADVTDVPEIRERVVPDFLSLAIAIGAGVAGIVSLTTGVSTALVGVMIAVALIPPAATVGIGLAWGQPMVSLGAGVLVLVNVLSINLAALIVLWYKGYRPVRWFREDAARKATIRRIAVLALSILLLSAFLGSVTYDSFHRATVEESIQEDAEAVMATADAQEEPTVIDVEVIYPNALPFQQPDHVIVTVGIPPDASIPGLADDLRAAITDETNGEITVEVRYVTTEHSTPG